MDKTCPCGKIFFVKTYLLHRKKYCCKECFYKYHGRKSGLKYIKHKENPTSFKKGIIPWNKGLFLDEKAVNWKGDKVGYWGIHSWIESRKGKPKICELCNTTKAKRFDWANKSGLYKRKFSDWQRLCVTCHFNYDKQKFGTRNSFHR